MAISLINFQEALDKSDQGKRHLLLGNGFSQAWRHDVFSYGALYESADFSTLSKGLPGAFDALATKDFEIVIKALQDTAKIIKVYKSADPILRKTLVGDAKKLKQLLVETIAKNHPETPNDVTSAQYKACREFLGHFGRIYTLNYDLLLYWTLLHQEDDGEDLSLVMRDDGFRTVDGETNDDSDYVSWEEDKADKQNVFYLHGALHIFDAGAEIRKFTWRRTGERLKAQVLKAMENEMYPLFVSEGSSDQKKSRIRHSAYLSRCVRSLLKISGSLFVFGHSLADNDEHILHMIEKNKGLKQLFISVYGEPTSQTNKALIKRAKLIADRRETDGRSIDLHFYCAKSAAVWGI